MSTNNDNKNVQVYKMLKKKITDPQILQKINNIEKNGLYNLINNQKVDKIILFFNSLGDPNSKQIANLFTKLKSDLHINGDKIYADVIRDIDSFATLVINCLFIIIYILFIILILSLMLVENLEFIKGIYVLLIITVATIILYIIFRIIAKNQITKYIQNIRNTINHYEYDIFSSIIKVPKSILHFIENVKL